MKKSVIVVDDHPLYQKALVALVRELGAAEEVVAAYSAEEGLRLIRGGTVPSLILLDLGLPGMRGVEAVASFRHACPQAVIVIVSASEQRQEAAAAARAGANAVVSKGVEMEALRGIVSQALSTGLQAGQKWVTSPGALPLGPDSPVRLTPRQTEIVALLSQGLPNKEIGIRMGLAEITVKTHLSSVFKLLGVVNRTQAVMAIRRLGIAVDAPAPKEETGD